MKCNNSSSTQPEDEAKRNTFFEVAERFRDAKNSVEVQQLGNSWDAASLVNEIAIGISGFKPLLKIQLNACARQDWRS